MGKTIPTKRRGIETFLFKVQKYIQLSEKTWDAENKVKHKYKYCSLKRKVVEYTYDYYSPAKNVRDLSTERYIFEGEQSWGEYTTHQINILPNQPGKLVHSVVNGKPAIMLDGKSLEDEAALGATQFLRTVNYFWFMMPFKLSDPSTKST